MAYLPGIGRTLTQTMDISGAVSAHFYNGPTILLPGTPLPPNVSGTMALALFQNTVQIEPYSNVIKPTPPGGGEYADGTVPVTVEIGITVTAYAQNAAEPTTQNFYNTYTLAAMSDAQYSYSFAGTILSQVDVERVVDVEYSGSWGIPDTFPPSTLTIGERVKVGGSAVIVALGVSSTGVATGTATSLELYAIYLRNIHVYAEAYGGASVTWSAEFGVTNVPWSATPASRTYTDATGNGATLSGMGTVQAVSTTNPSGPQEGNGAVATSVYGDKTATIIGSIRAMDEAYPGTLQVDYTGIPGVTAPVNVGGTWSQSVLQQFYSVGGLFNNFGLGGGPFGEAAVEYFGPSADQWSPITGSITAASLTAAGEDARASRLLARCFPMGSASVSHATEYVFDASFVDAGTTVSPTGTATTTVAPGSLQIATGSGGPGGANIVYATERGSTGYGWMRITMATTAGGGSGDTFSLTIPGNSNVVDNTKTGQAGLVSTGAASPSKTWNGLTLPTSGSGPTPIDVYLPLPDNWAGPTDGQDSVWPMPFNTVATLGVCRIGQIQMTGIPASTTVVISKIELIRKGPLTLDFLPTFERGVLGNVLDEPWHTKSGPDYFNDSGTDAYHYGRRFLLGVADGTHTIDEFDMTDVHIDSSESSDSPGVISIAGLIANVLTADAPLDSTTGTIVRHPGWSASSSVPVTPVPYAPTGPADYPPMTPYLLNDSQPSTFIGGGGATYLAGEWFYPLGLVGDSQSPSAQFLADFNIEWFPGCGDVFNVKAPGGPVDTGITIPVAAILRGGAHGLTAKPNYTQESGVVITLSESGVPDSSATSDAYGAFRTGADYAKSATSAMLKPVGGTALAITEILGRHRHWGGFISASCPTLFLGDPLSYFPFTPQFSDPNVLPTEEWRRIKAAAADSGFNNAADLNAASVSSIDEDAPAGNGSGTS